MEYFLVEEYDSEESSNRVTVLLNEGWELYGSPVVAAYYAKGDEDNEHRISYVQALTKKDESLGVFVHGSASREQQ